MFKQRRLEFVEDERLEEFWERFPEHARGEVTEQYARLMARTSVQRIRSLRTKQEAGDEPNEC